MKNKVKCSECIHYKRAKGREYAIYYFKYCDLDSDGTNHGKWFGDGRKIFCRNFMKK